MTTSIVFYDVNVKLLSGKVLFVSAQQLKHIIEKVHLRMALQI